MSKIDQGRKIFFMFYTGFMFLEKCQKYNRLERIDAPLKCPWENQVFFYLGWLYEFIDDSKDNYTQISFQ